MDDELIGHGIRAITGYAMGGNRLHGADIAPAIRHVGHKMATVSKYMQLARAGYNLGRKAINSFSQKKKTKNKMPPVTPPKTPKKGAPSKYPTSGEILADFRARQRAQYAGTKKGKPIRRMLFTAAKKTANNRRRKVVRGRSARIAKARSGQGLHDYFCKRGVLTTAEVGGVILGSTVNQYQTLMLGHATHGVLQTLKGLSLAIVKAALAHVNITFDSVNDVVLISNRTLVMRFEFRSSPAGSALFYSYNIVSSPAPATTPQMIADAVYTNIFAGYPEVIMDEIVMFWGAEAGLTQTVQICKLDMEKASIDLYSKSSLKMQNQTVADVDDKELDSVDNVPLIGKQYDGSGNYIQIEKTFYYPGASIVGNYYANGFGPGSGLAEPQPLSVVKRANRVGSLKLQPGIIKTSVLTHRRKFNINTLLQMCARWNATENLCKLGKFRYFHVEKELQSVATTDANVLRLHYEIDLKSGVICNIKKKTALTMPVVLNPV
ncbi:MAG: Lake Sarah-associated circular virus [Bacteroidota bacterium]